ncbi:hypothetical protein QGM71_13785 [Virgibacillus sp. C22-A2]|uniref:DUF2642 domain-containing protein n=1 Tax=Virgibacillus tibetensis TaxID=3042313 RepID=A0ABU6KGY6_9BACI|nr:hypothetical protein [Virgibacillus sp. C22-A2]
MSVAHYHGLCQRYKGRAVVIKTRDGRTHRGIIQHVDGHRVYLQPLGGRGLGGYGYGGYGYGRFRRPRFGFGAGIVLGSIVTLALLPFFFI